MNPLELNTVVLAPDGKALEILDQTLLPGEVRMLRLSRLEDIWEAIRTLRVRGAPALGVCAGYALAWPPPGSRRRAMRSFSQSFTGEGTILRRPAPRR